MLKKFSDLLNFNHQKLTFDYQPHVQKIAGLTLQFMRANDRHLNDLMDLEARVYDGKTPWDKFSFRHELEKTKDSLYVVVYDGAKLVGFVGARFTLADSHITNIAVSPEYQHRGIATTLIGQMIDIARQNGSKMMSLEVRIDNAKAQTLYKKIGFQPNKVRKNYYADEHVDGVNMTMALTNES